MSETEIINAKIVEEQMRELLEDFRDKSEQGDDDVAEYASKAAIILVNAIDADNAGEKLT